MQAKKVRSFVVFTLLMSGCPEAGGPQLFDDGAVGASDAGIPSREVRRENGKKANDGPVDVVRRAVARTGDDGS